jgi:hypothetical protein
MALHIGKEIERKFDESGIKPGEFAKRINTGPRNIYTIFKRKDINSGLLKKISDVLEFDFFSLYRDEMPGLLSEPTVQFSRVRNVQVIVELDGDPDTLTAVVSRLQRLNGAI